MIRFNISDYAKFDDGHGQCTFIGRNRLVQETLDQLLKNRGFKYAYNGLFRNGKTSLFHEVQRLINLRYTSCEVKSLAVFFSLHFWSTDQRHFLLAIMEAIHDTAEKYITDKECENDAYRAFQATSTVQNQKNAMQTYLETLRSHYATHIILLLDEFQMLPELEQCTYNELACLHSLTSLTIAYIGRLPFDVTISRMRDRPLNADLTCMQKTVLGFNDDDIDIFFQVFLDQYRFDLTDYRKRIFYHCGRSPYLYAYIGQALQEKLDVNNYNGINPKWFETLFNAPFWEEYHQINTTSVLKNDIFRGMDNLTRLQRYFLGPRIAIRKNDEVILQTMGYIDCYGETFDENDEKFYAITPSFNEWLCEQEITGDLPLKIVFAEKLLKALIRSKAEELIGRTPQNRTYDFPRNIDYSWSPLDLAILNMNLKNVPATNYEKKTFGETYCLGDDQNAISKYTRYIKYEIREKRSPDLLGVLLLEDRLGILAANWDLFAGTFGGGTLDEWRERLIAWCVVRNPQFHANDELTEKDEALCERSCNDFIRAVGPLFPGIKLGRKEI